MEMRLQKFLSQAGVASRRHAEELIVAGRVWVNGKPVTELGSRVHPDRDKVTVDGKRVMPLAQRHIVLCKPKGYVTTRHDPEGRATVMDLLGERGAGLYPVGRLDFNTDGVLILTNDGELANALMHPSGGVPKTYHAKLHGEVPAGALVRLREGVVLDDGERTRPAEVMVIASTGAHTWLQITIRQGLNRQIHRMAEAIGHPVLKLSRVAYGPISSEGLRPGQWRDLTAEEVLALRRAVDGKGDARDEEPAAPRPGRSDRSGRSDRPGRPGKPKARPQGQVVRAREPRERKHASDRSYKPTSRPR